MEFKPTKFKDAWILQPKVWQDERGFFVESFSQKWFFEKGIDVAFVQDNHSKSVESGVLRGLHFQMPPHTQAKLVRITAGSVFDVIVDLRKESATYKQWQSFELLSVGFSMLYVPRGFAHGFCTLKPNTECMYKVDAYYIPASENGIAWDDDELKIPWPIAKPILSERDKKWPMLKNFTSPF